MFVVKPFNQVILLKGRWNGLKKAIKLKYMESGDSIGKCLIIVLETRQPKFIKGGHEDSK